jgi:thioredoxin reductase
MATSDAFDAAVVGGGAAGLSAALWLGRHRRSTVILDRGEPRNRDVTEVHGYLGNDRAGPGELLERARTDLARYEHVELRATGVASAWPHDDGFCLRTDDGEVCARRIVLATGIADVLPSIEGLSEHYGEDVHVCPICDGHEVGDEPIAVIGWSEEVASFSLTLLDWASTVTIATLGRRFEGDRELREKLAALGVTIEETEPVAFVGRRGALEGLTMVDGRTISCSKVFVKLGCRPATGLPEQLGCTVDLDGYVTVDECCETSVPGVYAAGDLTPGMQLVQVAAAKGAVAGVSCAQSLRGERPRRGAPEPAPAPEVLEG